MNRRARRRTTWSLPVKFPGNGVVGNALCISEWIVGNPSIKEANGAIVPGNARVARDPVGTSRGGTAHPYCVVAPEYALGPPELLPVRPGGLHTRDDALANHLSF